MKKIWILDVSIRNTKSLLFKTNQQKYYTHAPTTTIESTYT